jgi:hypothetical protein
MPCVIIYGNFTEGGNPHFIMRPAVQTSDGIVVAVAATDGVKAHVIVMETFIPIFIDP